MTDKKLIDFIGLEVKADEFGSGYIWGIGGDGGHQMIADVRGWGAIQNDFKRPDGTIDFDAAAKFQDQLCQWIGEACNEKLQRERKELYG